MKLACLKCETPLKPNNDLCPHCGVYQSKYKLKVGRENLEKKEKITADIAKLEAEQKQPPKKEDHCISCGNELAIEALFCGNCGKPVTKKLVEDKLIELRTKLSAIQTADTIKQTATKTTDKSFDTGSITEGINIPIKAILVFLFIAILIIIGINSPNTGSQGSDITRIYLKKGSLFCTSKEGYKEQIQIFLQGVKQLSTGCSVTMEDIHVIRLEGIITVKVRGINNGYIYWAGSESILYTKEE